MPEPKKEPQEEPRRTSQPDADPQPMTPMEPPSAPGTEFEKKVPHQGNQPIARSDAARSGEGSYEGTRRYDEGLERFSEEKPVEESLRDARSIDTEDPELKRAEKIGKSKSAESRPSAPSHP